MQAEELLETFMECATERGWSMMTHQGIREIEPMFEKASDAVERGYSNKAGSKEKLEYAARKMAYSPLQQEFTYYYYVGDYEVFYDHLNYLGTPVNWKVSLSPRLVKHMVQRDKYDTACFVILDRELNLAFATGMKVVEAIGPGKMVRLKSLIPSTSKWTRLNVPYEIFSNDDPFPDNR